MTGLDRSGGRFRVSSHETLTRTQPMVGRVAVTATQLLAISSNRAFGQAGAAGVRRRHGRILAGWWGCARATPLLRQLPRHGYLAFAGALVAVVMMQRALAMRDWEVAYVQQVGSDLTPRLYNIAAMWSALEGSILLWLVVLAGFVAMVGRRYRRRADDPLVAWALIVLFVILAFFALLTFGPASPFGAGRPGVNFGQGPNQLLQNHILVLFHPPIIYLGFTGLAVPFAFAIAALITGRVGEGWLLETRRWALFGWAFLTLGIILGGWWSYEVLGWGGVWGWDPVENASLLPWLTAPPTSIRCWCRSGADAARVEPRCSSPRSHSRSSARTSPARACSTASTPSALVPSAPICWCSSADVAVSLALIGWRGDRLRSPGTIDSPLARSAAFLVNNLPLCAVSPSSCCSAMIFPLLVEAIQSRQIKIGAVLPAHDDADRADAAVPDGGRFRVAVAQGERDEPLRQRLFWPAVVGGSASPWGVRRASPAGRRHRARSRWLGSPARGAAASCARHPCQRLAARRQGLTADGAPRRDRDRVALAAPSSYTLRPR